MPPGPGVNRSLYRRALRASYSTWRRDEYDVGGVEFAAVFPKGALEYEFGLPFAFDGFRPFGWGRWWRPDDPARPYGPGTAKVAFDYAGFQVWTIPIHVEPCGHEDCFPREPVSLYNLLDKPWRARWSEGKGGQFSDDLDEYDALTRDFSELERRLGFLPVMEEWVWDSNPLYGGRWYLPLSWTPYAYRDGEWEWQARPETPESGLRDVVGFLDGLRRDYRATIRVYPDRPDKSGDLRRTQPGRNGEDARHFLEGLEQWKKTGNPIEGRTYVLR